MYIASRLLKNGTPYSLHPTGTGFFRLAPHNLNSVLGLQIVQMPQRSPVFNTGIKKKTYVILRFPRTRSSRSSITSLSLPPETLHTGFL